MDKVSAFPVFKESVLSMIGELETVYLSTATVSNKANSFETILRKYGCA